MKNLPSKIIIVIFSVVGVFLIGTIVHENIHKFDYRDIDKFEEDICYLTFSGDKTGYYSFSYLPENTSKVKDISKNTEFKAYSIEALLFGLYIFSLVRFIREK